MTVEATTRATLTPNRTRTPSPRASPPYRVPRPPNASLETCHPLRSRDGKLGPVANLTAGSGKLE